MVLKMQTNDSIFILDIHILFSFLLSAILVSPVYSILPVYWAYAEAREKNELGFVCNGYILNE